MSNIFVPEDFYCPITGDLMKDPVSEPEGHTYERDAIMKWLSKNTDFKKSNINLVMRSQKQKYAMRNGKPNILIDDYVKNIKEWEAKGGIGVHHTDVSKTVGKLKRLGFK